MGPKKKKGGKGDKKGGGSSKEDAMIENAMKPPVSFQVSRQLDQEKINALSNRVESLLDSNNALRTSSTRNEKDTHDIVLYFQRDLEVKDELIHKLNEELVKRETQLKFEVDRMTTRFNKEFTEMQTNTQTRIEQLATDLEAAERELKLVETFRKEKDSHMRMIDTLKSEKSELEIQMTEQVEELERKFLEDKAVMMRDAEKEKAAFREVAIKEAKEMMGKEVLNLMKENTRMQEELRFHHQVTTDLQKDRDVMEKNLSRLNRELVILNDKEEEYARQGLVKSKEIRALRERVEQLEKQQIVNIERFKLRTKELKNTVTKELEDATLDAAGLRRLIKIKNKELRHMKSLAATILSQRSEVEQYFLDSLTEVKDKIGKERRQKKLADMAAIAKGNSNKYKNTKNNKTTSRGTVTTGLPRINVHHTNEFRLGGPEASKLPTDVTSEKVTLKDLSWSDKELVLRVLFAKMNGLQSTVDNAVEQTRKREKSNDTAVFVSEGGGVGMNETEISAYQDMFQVDGPDVDDEEGYDNQGYDYNGEEDEALDAQRVIVESYRNNGSVKVNLNDIKLNKGFGDDSLGAIEGTSISLSRGQTPAEMRSNNNSRNGNNTHHVVIGIAAEGGDSIDKL